MPICIPIIRHNVQALQYITVLFSTNINVIYIIRYYILIIRCLEVSLQSRNYI
jgi:hypothetical protein